MDNNQRFSGSIWENEDVDDEYSYNPEIEPYENKLKKYKEILESNYKDIDPSDEDKKKILYKIISIPREMIEADKSDFGDIQELIDEDACKELGYSIDYVTEEYLEEYIYFFRSKHSQLADYYDYMGYSYY